MAFASGGLICGDTAPPDLYSASAIVSFDELGHGTVKNDPQVVIDRPAGARVSDRACRALFNSTDVGFCIVEVLFDLSGKARDYVFIETNPAFEQQTGLVDAAGKRMRELAPDHEQVWFDTYGRIALTGQPERFEHRAEALGRWFAVYAFRVEEDDAHHVGILFNEIGDRKRAEAAATRSEAKHLSVLERQAFLLSLGDAMRAECSTQGLLETSARLLGERMGASRVLFAEFDHVDGVADIFHGWFADGATPFPSVMRLEDYEGPILSDLGLGRTVRIDDTLDPAVSRPDLKAIADLGVMALLSVPLIVGGRLVVNLSIHQHAVRHWTDEDVALVQEVAERLWADLVRARAETALRKSEERLRQFGEASQDILWIRDAETFQWCYLTPSYERIYGQSREAALAGDNFAGWLDSVVPEDRCLAQENMRRVQQGEHVTFELRIRRQSDGALRWVRNTDFPIRNETGEIVMIGGIGHDLTELRETELRLRTLLQGIPQLVWRARGPGEWTWASPQWTEFTGQPEDESLGWGWLGCVHPDDRAAARAAWETAGTRGAFEIEYRVRGQAKGKHYWFQTRATPVRDADGRIVEWLGTSTDVDESRQLQNRQEVLVRELQHRTFNLMAVVRSISALTIRSSDSMQQFKRKFDARISVLARVQRLLSRLQSDRRVVFDELLRGELEAVGAFDEEGRVTLRGPDGVELRSRTVQTLAMAIHELATNAVKYGALGQEDARLEVRWEVALGHGERPCREIEWRETGVAMPERGEPSGTGQGRELLEHALPYQLGAQTRYVMAPDGVCCSISLPLSPDAHSGETYATSRLKHSACGGRIHPCARPQERA